jgi:cation diffusion facilitator family transporter
MSIESTTRTIWVALAADFGIGLAKAGAAVLTGSAAMAAEAAHSLTDVATGVLLVVAQHRSTRDRDDQHPLGYGREIYFWTLLVALGVLVAGALFSLREGIEELIHPSVTSRFAVAYVVLAIATVFDLTSFRQSAGQMSNRARRRNVSLLSESQATSDSSLRTVFLQDTVSVLGDLMAFAALGLNQITASSIPQGIVAVLIGVMLIHTGGRLVQRSHDFLVGAWLLTSPAPEPPRRWVLPPVTQPFQPSDEEGFRTFLLGYPGVTAIRELLVTFVGPNRLWVIAHLEIDNNLRGDQVTSLVRDIIASGLRHESEAIYRVDIVPIGGAKVVP